LPLQPSALIFDVWQSWSCPTWRQQSFEHPFAQRRGQEPCLPL
jgi:hypothetical protein